MMMKRLTTAVLATLMLAAAPGVASAQETSTADPEVRAQEGSEAQIERDGRWFDALQARALEAIDQRLATIAELEAAIERSDAIDPGHSGQLMGELRGSAAGLESLSGKIERAEDLAALWELVPKIFEDYRIYAVLAPKVHLVLVADSAAAIADRLEQAAGTLGTALDRLEGIGIDVTEADALLAEMQALVAAGAESAASVPDMVLGLTPADYPGSSEILRSAHSELKGAGEDLRTAGATAHEIVRFIVGALGGGDTD
jgi:hypothetical protein